MRMLTKIKLHHIMQLFFCLVTSSSFSQWIVEDTILGNELLKIENENILTQQGEEYFCGLPKDNDQYNFEYYVRTDDIVYFIAKNKIDVTQIHGFFKKGLFMENICWRSYLLWQYFDAKGVLIKTEYIDENANVVEPLLYDSK